MSSASPTSGLLPVQDPDNADSADSQTDGTTVTEGVATLFNSNASIGASVNSPLGIVPDDTVSAGAYAASATATPTSTGTGAVVPGGGAATPSGAASVVVADGGSAEIDGANARPVTFEGETGTLTLDDSVGFTGQISGLTGADAVDLADVSFGSATTATFLGNASGGTLTVSDGTHTANIELQGDYLSSTWDVSSDGKGGTVVVDPVSTNTWQTLPVGAGGFVDGIDIAPDDTMVVRTDSYGAYIWNGTQWQQLITNTSMPAAFIPTNSNAGTGVYEIQIAPSNSNILYMMYEGDVFKSINKGTTWTQTSFAPVTESPNTAYRMDGQKMAIDPENSNIVYAGTPQNGLFVTTNGGTTWQSVSAVPDGVADSSGVYPGITGIAFDPALGVSGGKTNTIFAASFGDGVYESTNGGTSWSAIGGPSDVAYAAVSSTGVYYAVGNGNSLWSYNKGAWTDLLSLAGIATVAVDPFNPNEIVVQEGSGTLDISYNGGATWSGANSSANFKFNSPDVPWLSDTGSYMTIGGTVFDQLTPNTLLASDGVGVWNTTDLPTQGFQSNTPVAWNSQSEGIEQLVANEIIVPPGGDPVLASWDRGFFTISNQSADPSTYGPVNGKFAAGWSVDYASSNPSFLVGLADWWNNEESGYSTNGGQTWTPFPTFIPGASTAFMGGTIAASTPNNIIWAPADGVDPYYTLNGGQTWNPITLPGVTSWKNFDYAYYLDTETVTADRVLANTFYLYDPGIGVFETTNGGVSWTKQHGPVSGADNANSEIQSVPGEAGNLFFTPGPQNTAPDNLGFYRSTDQGVTWTAIPNVLDVSCFGFGAAAPGQSYPSIYIVGWVNKVYGIWQSTNNTQSWTQIGTYPTGSLDLIRTIAGNPNVYGQVYVGFAGDGYAEFTANPSVTGVTATPSKAVEQPGDTITLTLTMSEAVTVTGTPTLSLNDGGTATYKSGSGSNALTFTYTVSGSDHDVPALGINQVNLPNGATITDANANAANLAGAVTTISGLQIDPPAGVVSVATSGSGITNGGGDLNGGHAVTFTINVSQAAYVSGTPTLTLNDGGTATYTGGSGTDALTFSYKVVGGQNTSDLAVTAVNLGTATVTDVLGNAINLTAAVTNPGGILQIDTVDPTIASVVASGVGISNSLGDVDAGHVVTLTVKMSEAVFVANGTPTLTLNDGGVATYTGGSGTSSLSFSYTVAAGQNATALAIAKYNLGTATITDGAGNPAILSYQSLTNLKIDTTVPTIASVVESPATGTLGDGKIVTLKLAFSEAVTVANGTPTLTLNDGGVATYTNGSGTQTLTFSYMVANGQATSALAATVLNLNNATISDGAGNAAKLSLAGLTQSGPQINTTAPIISSVTESPATGTLGNGKIVTLKLGFSEAVTVANGTPTLTLNDGGLATYTSGSGSNALTFSYTVAAGQNTTALAATVVNLNNATITDGAGNAAKLSLAGLTQTGPQINGIGTTATTITAVTESPANGDYDAGHTGTLTLTFKEAVTVAKGTPTLTLNDGGTATYTSGSGSNALIFSYTVAAGQNAAALAATVVNLNNATITDSAGNAANLSLAGLTQTGPQIDTTAPTVSAVTQSPANGDLDAGHTGTLTLSFKEAVTVAKGTPTLTLNDGGLATYTGGSGSNALTFSYTIAAGQNAAALAATVVNLNNATITDTAGNAANLSLAGLTQTGPQIDTTAPTITGVAESPANGDLDAGNTGTLTLSFGETVTVANGTPTLTLNDGGLATYTGGSGSNALTFSYTIAAGQTAAALAATMVNLNNATITDSAGNAANLSLAGLTQTGPQINTTAPAITAVAESPANGDLDAGNTGTLTLSFAEAVTVANGTPTLTLNDGGLATYTGGSGSNALTFSYTIAAGQNAAALAATVVNLNNATITDAAGNAANLSLAGLTQTGPQINTTAPAITAVAESPANGDLDAGNTGTLTLSFGETVTVAKGTPTLTLNDGGVATYTNGSGSNALTFSYTIAAGQNAAALAATVVNLNNATITDSAGNAANLSLAGLTQTGPQINTTAPTITAVAESPANGDFDAGNTGTLTLSFGETVTVANGTPTLTLNDGGTATYTSGSGSNALTFSYTIAAGQNAAALAATLVNLNNATITDGAGNAANLSLAGLTQTGPQINTTAPTITAVAESPANGDLDAGNTGTLTLSFGDTVTVANGTPTLTLNDGGVATYTSGSGSNALTFSYTIAAGQNAAALAATMVNLNNATITDSAGNAANLSLAGLTQTGPQINTTAPTITAVAESPANGDLDAGNIGTLTLSFGETVTVANGTPTLTLNDGGSATYISGSGSNALTFSYTVTAGQNAAALAATLVNLNNATITDGAGNAANLSLAGLTQTGPQINTTAPTITAVAESPANGDLDAGNTGTLTLSFGETVTVANGTPTLTLNDGGTATYTSGSGSNALTFSYTVAAGQNAAALAATVVNLNNATITDGAGNAANLSLAGLTQTGPQINTTAPTITAVAESPANGDLDAGNTGTLTLSFGETVTVANGTPTLTLNDGGVATYVSGSGSNALTFSYTVAAGQNAAALAATLVNLNNATITDAAGNAANLSLAGLTQTGPQINTTAPSIASVTESPANGDLDAGNTGTLTLSFGETVTVANGTPTLTLSDGGTATYVSGSGSNALTFSYTVTAGQNAAALAATVVNLNNATISDAAGNAANLSLAGLTQTGPQIDTTPPAAPVIQSDTVNADDSVTLVGTAEPSSTVMVYDGQTALGTTATNVSGAWSFTSAPLPNGNATFYATATDAAGNTSALSAPLDPTIGNIAIDTTQQVGTPAVLNSGDIQIDGTLTVDVSTLTLNGTGAISLAGGSIVGSAGGETLQNDGNTISGTGVIGDGSGNLDLNNASGAITAANGTLVLDTGSTITNNATLNAANGATLQIDDSVTGSGTQTVGAGAVLTLAAADSQSVAFTASTGILALQSPSSFTGTVSGMQIGDAIDLTALAYNTQSTLGYLPNGNQTGGTLTLTDGTYQAKIALFGSYMASSFAVATDGHGGTMITDVPPPSGAGLAHPLPA